MPHERKEVVSRQRISAIRHPDRTRARQLVYAATQRGDIEPASAKFCCDCGAPAHEYDHFLGYDERFSMAVQPVCRTCHGKRLRLYEYIDCPECGAQFIRIGGAKYCSIVCKHAVWRRDKSVLEAKRRRGQEMFNLYQEGFTQAEIAKQFGLTQSAVSSAIRRLDKRDHSFKLRPADVDVIRARLANQEPMTAIANDFGVTPANIRSIRDGLTWKPIPSRRRERLVQQVLTA